MLSSLARAKELSRFLEENGIIVPFMNYPVKLEFYILRIAVSTDHTDDQAVLLVDMLKKWRDKNGTH